MTNILLFFISIILIFSSLILVNKIFGATGIIGFMGIATILANILICKNINLLKYNTTLGNIMFASNFLATDILTECYGIQTAKKGIKFAIISAFGFLITTQIAMLFKPNNLDFAQPAFQTLFTLTPRIILASISLFILSNFIDVYLYQYLKIKTNNKYMWLRNNLCTILCNGSENFLFYIIAFLGTFTWENIIILSITATIIEIIIALCDTPFLYLAKYVHNKEIAYE